MNPAWLTLSAGGLVVLVLSTLEARSPVIPPWEGRVFRWINRWPDWLYGVLWLPMQLGNLVVGVVAGLAVAVIAGDAVVAVGVVLAALLKVVIERVIRREMHAHLRVRVRPGTSQAPAILRGDVPDSGPSFPSGHAILVAAIGSVTAPVLPVGAVWVPFVCMGLVMVGRVYVGAHNPLDVSAGLGAGLVLGGVLAAFVAG
jgi:membrane-associated phospholipid phosphatase